MKSLIKQIKKIVKGKVRYDKYWEQKLSLINIEHRKDYFFPKCKDKNVLHFGCTDFPIFDPHNNLHIELNKIAKTLHGFDIDTEGIQELRKYVDQPYYSNYKELSNNDYDVCLVPETIEHVDNVRSFLEDLSTVNAELFIITGPNCFKMEHMTRNAYKNGIFTEIVHPDHNCWYSPYTLKNVIEKYSSLEVKQVYLLEDERMVCCECIKKSV